MKSSITNFLLALSLVFFFPHSTQNSPQRETEKFLPGKYLLMDKSDQTLYLIEDQKLKAKYSAVYGSNKGKKEKIGDNKTPEGTYTICYKNPNSEWKLFFGIDYPNVDDALKGLEANTINQREYEQIQNDSCPKKWYTRMGGEIGIHGIAERYVGFDPITALAPTLQQNWTNGCIGLRNSNLAELEKEVSIGTKIVIRE